jgi:hypothetical protein
MKNLKPHDSRMEDLSNSFEKITSEFFTNVFAFLESTTIKGVVSIDKTNALSITRCVFFGLKYRNPC